MHRVHEFSYSPILIGGKKRYLLELPVDDKPVVFKTMTTDMGAWFGEVELIITNQDIVGDEGPMATVMTAKGALMGRLIGPVTRKGPAWVMEHLTVDGRMEYVVASERLLEGNQNFVNYGVPQGKYLRIDIYTGEHRIINA